MDTLGPDIQPEGKPFVVIAGAPRSGTYLMVTHLERHFSVATPLETHFIPLFNWWKFLWGDLTRSENRRKLVDDIYAFLAIWGKASRVAGPEMAEFNLLSTHRNIGQIVDSTRSYDEIVQIMFRCYADMQGRELAGEKSAFYSLIPLARTAECFGDRVRVIHIVRDGRDVANSWMSMWTGPETLTAAARLWRDHVRQKVQWGVCNPHLYLELKYEDFLSDPASCNRRISAFLGVSERSSEPRRMSEVLSKLPTHQKVSGSLKQTNSFKWRNEMSESAQKLFEYYAGDVLAEHGYEIAGFTYSPVDRVNYFVLRLGGGVIMALSIRRWKNRLKNILPLLLWISRKVRLQKFVLRLAT